MMSLRSKSIMVFAGILFLALLCLKPVTAQAEETEKTVRVGWYESPFNLTDKFGRKTGYGYDYQRKIAAYTGWNYEYVEGSWPELFQMLKDGEIDLLSDVSYTDERSEQMLFSDIPMGEEEYYVFVSPKQDSGLDSGDLSTFNGKKIGFYKGSVPEECYIEWEKDNGVHSELIEMTEGENETAVMMDRGEIDAYVTIDSFGGYHDMIPVQRVGSSSYFFAVSNEKPEMLKELNEAMSAIHDEDIFFAQHLWEKYFSYSRANLFLSPNEEEWLADHGTIRVGYRDDYMAFCSQDEDTGELTGALKEVLYQASVVLANTELKFSAYPFQTTEEALKALEKGDIDCVFPIHLSDYDSERINVLTTIPLMQTEMVALYKATRRDFSQKRGKRVAVEKGDPNNEAFLMDNFPDWKRVYVENYEACYKAVEDGKADCLLEASYRLNFIDDELESNKLSWISTGEGMDLSFAVRDDDMYLYSILDKVINGIPSSDVNSALAASSYVNKDVTFRDFLVENTVPVVSVGMIIIAIIFVLLLRSIQSEHRTREAVERITALNTELSDSRENLIEALRFADQANKAKTSFLSNMSHEIRTPMNAIIGLNNLALKEADLTPHIRELLDQIGASARHLLDIINDVLDMSRIESGKMTLKDSDFCFQEFLEQINVMINGQCKDKGLQYECKINGSIDDYYVGDDMKLKQVLINILGNAVKFTEAPGKITFTVEQTASFKEHRSLRFVVSDTGIGMDKDYIPKIFTAFSQEIEGRSNKYGSTGLGMAITKNIVTMMNGDIHVDSEKGVGSTFTVNVTLKASGQSAIGNYDETLFCGMRALILEEDKAEVERILTVAEVVGISAEVSQDRARAYDMFCSCRNSGNPYGLVLTADDGQSGTDMAAFIRSLREIDNGRSIIILLTDYNGADRQDEEVMAGVDAILSKPLFTTSLVHSVQDILLRRKGSENDTAGQSDNDNAESAGLDHCRVLVVDDMDVNAQILMALLETKGVKSEHARDGSKAVEMFSEHPEGYYDAIFMDIRMPVMDGLEATTVIRSLKRPDAEMIPIIAMTANAFEEDVQRSLQAGMNAHLSKPIEPEAMFDTLGRIIKS